MSKAKGRKKHPVFKGVGIFLGAILALVILLALVVIIKANFSYSDLTRVDDGGSLYYATYTGNYASPIVSMPLNLFGGVGCSAFITQNEDGDVITCRNYDFPHTDDEGNPTGLNVIVRCSPKNGYSSIGVADIGLFSEIGLPYYAGAFESGVSKVPLMFLPYFCMDGMNEKGVCVSILALDIKDGETPMRQTAEGKENLMVNTLLRIILDSCKSVDEAVQAAENCNMTCTFGNDYHLFVSDASGRSVVMEWRYNNLTVTQTNAVTNFYVGYDDACDCYSHGKLKEKFVQSDDHVFEYHYGYGHGYARFAKIADALDEHISGSSSAGTSMTDDEAFGILASVAQSYDPESSTSFTEYSAIYNNSSLTLDICSLADYSSIFTYTVNG